MGLMAILLILPEFAAAQSASQIRLSAQQIDTQIVAKTAANAFDTAAQQHAIEELGKLTVAFITLSDQAAHSGEGKAERESLLAAFEAVKHPLEKVYDQSAGVIERMTRQIMDEDGDLEALYETPEYKRGQVVGSQSLYYLNWLRYYGSRLFDGARRKELLEQAQRGFSEFAGGEKRSGLQVESVLGRGLCALELGDLELAGSDLKAVAADLQVPAEQRSKARLALLDGYVRNGRAAEAIKLSDQMLSEPQRSDANLIRYLRARALLDGAGKATGGEGSRRRQEALAVLEQLRRAGGTWAERATALLAHSVDDPEKWAGDANNPFARWELAKMLIAKKDDKKATPLLEEVVKANDPALRPIKGEAQYYLGLARFRAGAMEDAASELDAALKAEKAPYAVDAAYLRFKAREALAAKSTEAATNPAYEEAVRDYVVQFPQHASAYEGYFRLGELLQARKQFDEAIAAYEKVKGDPGFELRALFATLQCRFERLQEAGAPRESVLEEIGREIPRLEQELVEAAKRQSDSDVVPLAPIRAKLTLMKAVYGNLLPDADPRAVIALLDGFEKRFPDQPDLYPQAARLRLAADQPLGRFTEAEADARSYGQALVGVYGAAAVEDLAVAFVREGARRNASDPLANESAQRVALILYEQLPADGENATRSRLTRAKLYENIGDFPKAAALYKDALGQKGDSLPALRGLARTEEAQNRIPGALAYWQQITTGTRPGDAPWYEGQYQTARLNSVLGKTKEACSQLEKLKPSMPGLSDIELRSKLDVLYRQVCK